MITLRKLESLPEGTRGRKLLTLLSESHDEGYDRGLVRMALALLDPGAVTRLSQEALPSTTRERQLLRQCLAQKLGISAADWDLQTPPDREGPEVRFPLHVWLDGLRSPFNVGSLVRTAEAYGFTSLSHSPETPGLDHPRTLRSAMGAEKFLKVSVASLELLRSQWSHRPVFALELGGMDVEHFQFPGEGLVLVGGEEVGLSPEALAWADGSAGRVSLPLYGRKASLNVGVAFGVLAAAWTARLRPR